MKKDDSFNLLTPTEAANFLHTSKSWLRKVSARGDIEGVIETPLGRFYQIQFLLDWLSTKRKRGRPKKLGRPKKRLRNK